MGESALLVDEFVFTPETHTRRLPSRKPMFVTLSGAVVIALLAGVFVIRTGDEAVAQTYRYDFEIGSTRTYAMTMSMRATPAGADAMTGKLTASLGLEVVDKKEDGSATIDLTMSGVTMEPALPGSGELPSKLTLNVAPDGRVSSVEGVGGVIAASSGGSPADVAGNQSLFPQFPTQALKPGDDWAETSTMRFPFGDDTITMSVQGTHEGFEDTAYGEAAKVHHLVSAPFDMSIDLAEMANTLGGAAGLGKGAMTIVGDIDMDTTSLVIPSTNDLVRMDGTVTSKLHMSMSGAPSALSQDLDATMDLSIVRVA